MKRITETIEEYFDGIEASKDYYGYFYSMTEAIIIAILGTFCGIIEIPCYSWFMQILGIINPKSFNECFIKWALNLVGGQTKDSTISFDGKTVRSTGKMKNYTQPLYIVSGHLAELGITLGQKAVSDKSNEIPAVRDLIELLDINGCLIVADALSCQKETAKVIIKNGGGYLLSVLIRKVTPNLKLEQECGLI